MGIVKMFEDFMFDDEMERGHHSEDMNSGFSNPNRVNRWHIGNSHDRNQIRRSSPSGADNSNYSKRQLAGKTRISSEDTMIMDTPEWTIVVPHSYRASCYWGKGANWSTCERTPEGEAFFNKYKRNGDLIIIKDKTQNQMYQLQISTGMFFNQYNKQINCSEFFAENPEIYDMIYSSITPDEKREFNNLCSM